MILLIDNYDSFTYNIYQYLLKLGAEVKVYRHDRITVDEIAGMNPDHIVISPGPGNPDEAGISIDVIREFSGKIPILGICLGHQCIGQAFGGEIVRASKIFHGKTSEINHDGRGVFNGIKDPFTATRYHSLVIRKQSLPPELEITAEDNFGEIMGVRHRIYSVEGIQFHPESIGTEYGLEMLRNFITNESKQTVMKTALKKVHSGRDLTESEAEMVMEEITSGEATPAQIAGILTGISMKGESVSELTGFARVMRRKATAIRKPPEISAVDTCGTGGDGSNTFNVSTVCAFVTAGAGCAVAKHGNRSVTSRCGSADLLEALGINILRSPEVIEKAFMDAGIAFLFAPSLHKSMKHAVPVRKELGIRTAFNIIGPLTNPAGAEYQVIGVYAADLTEKVAKVLVNLGTSRAMVVHGCDGLDEITMTGRTKISEVRDGWIRNYFLDPVDYGFSCCSPEDLEGGDLKTNSEICLSILEGRRGPKRDIVLINSAAAIYVSGHALNLAEAVEKARISIDSGSAMQKLEDLIKITGEK